MPIHCVMTVLAKYGSLCHTRHMAIGESLRETPLVGDARDDCALAEALARAAGDVLLSLSASSLFAGRDRGRAGDQVSQHVLADALGIHRPDDAVLSEEAVNDPARLDAERVWIIDPLDGTREYGEGREDWAVHVALVVDGTPGASAVALPHRRQIFSSSGPALVPDDATRPLRIAVSRSRPPAFLDAVASELDAELVPMGSAGFKGMAVMAGEVDAYVHAGGQYEWDSAAPVGVAQARGLHCSRCDGSPLIYNRPDPLLPDLVICRPELAERLLSAIAKHATP